MKNQVHDILQVCVLSPTQSAGMGGDESKFLWERVGMDSSCMGWDWNPEPMQIFALHPSL